MTDHPAPGVRTLGLRVSQAYLVDLDDRLLLVDAGVPGNAARILAAIRDAGRSPADLGSIAVTHQHADHAGSVAAVARATGAEVHVHALDAPPLRDGRAPVTGTLVGPLGRLGDLGSAFVPRAPLDAAPIARELADGDRIGGPAGLRVLHTPGHTPGHVSLLLERDGGTLFVGDAASNLLGRLGRPIVAADWAAVARSAALIASLDFEVALFGHGPAIRGGAVARFRRLAERLATR